MKAVQYFSDEQLQRSLAMSVTERMRFLDQYRQLYGTQIKQLMMESIGKDQALRARNKKLTP